MRRIAALLLALLMLPSPAPAAYDVLAWLEARLAPDDVPMLPDSSGGFEVRTVCAGLESPWAVAFLPDGRVLVSERPGRLRVVRGGRLDPEPVPGVPQVAYEGQGGLLDIAVHPGFAENGLIYLAYTVREGGDIMTRVSRFRLTDAGLSAPEVIFAGVPGSGQAMHFGCRLAFGADGMLYLTLGERHEGWRAQDLGQLNGKTLRLTPEGGVPADNPFVGRADARPEIFTYGNRNSQGLAVQPGTGLFFATEHGPSWNDAPGGGDEVNVLLAGRNYGWPEVHHRQTRPDVQPPIYEHTPALAPSGCDFVSGSAFPGWQGDFVFACLRGERLVRLKLDGVRPVGQEHLLKGRYGRLRDVACAPDGSLYVLTSNTDAYGSGGSGGDRLLRLMPR